MLEKSVAVTPRLESESTASVAHVFLLLMRILTWSQLFHLLMLANAQKSVLHEIPAPMIMVIINDPSLK